MKTLTDLQVYCLAAILLCPAVTGVSRLSTGVCAQYVPKYASLGHAVSSPRAEFDLLERGVLSAVQAPGVDAQEDVDAVTGPLGYLGRRHSPFGRFMSTYEHTNSYQLVVAAWRRSMVTGRPVRVPAMVLMGHLLPR